MSSSDLCRFLRSSLLKTLWLCCRTDLSASFSSASSLSVKGMSDVRSACLCSCTAAALKVLQRLRSDLFFFKNL